MTKRAWRSQMFLSVNVSGTEHRNPQSSNRKTWKAADTFALRDSSATPPASDGACRQDSNRDAEDLISRLQFTFVESCSPTTAKHTVFTAPPHDLIHQIPGCSGKGVRAKECEMFRHEENNSWVFKNPRVPNMVKPSGHRRNNLNIFIYTFSFWIYRIVNKDNTPLLVH